MTPAIPAYGTPQTFGLSPEATLRGDGSILIKPGETAILKFEVRDGKIAKLIKLPFDTKETENTIRVGLLREGGVETKLGPTSPITDKLFVSCSTKQSLIARCEYMTLNAPKPERARLSGKDGSIQRKFRWGLSQVIITELQFDKP